MLSSASAAFADPEAPFAEFVLSPCARRFSIGSRTNEMRLAHPSQMVLPLMVVLIGTLLVMSRLDMIQTSRYLVFRPASLIALGLEELYLWTRSGEDK